MYQVKRVISCLSTPAVMKRKKKLQVMKSHLMSLKSCSKEKEKRDINNNNNVFHYHVSSQSKNSGVKYDTTIVAPARKMPSVASNAMVLRSNTPALAAA